MPQSKIKESLTLRIFLVTFFILLLASAVTFGIIALATPITYSSIASEKLLEYAQKLPYQLEQVTLDDCGTVLDEFIKNTSANIIIMDEQGNVIETPSNLSITVTREKSDSSAVTDTVTDTVITSSAIYGYEDGEQRYIISDDELAYPFSFAGSDKVYFVHIYPQIERSNQTVQALGKVAPWLLGAMLLFSALCSLFYSRWITMPVVRLSGISKKMAELDFSWKCEEKRRDEIGVLGQSLDTLSVRLSSALSELREANAQLKLDIDRERELEAQRLTFFSAASHELKTPITIIKGQLTGMLEGVGIYKDRDKYLASSLQAAGRMEALVQEILTVSRMESDGFSLNTQELCLTKLIENQLELCGGLAEEKRQHISTALEQDVSIKADPVLIEKVLDNLLTNAFFYSPDEAEIRIALEKRDKAARLCIENFGVSISQEAISHVFEPFYRAESSRNRATGGSGLGLYIVDKILQFHKAEYKIESSWDSVRFTIDFSM